MAESTRPVGEAHSASDQQIDPAQQYPCPQIIRDKVAQFAEHLEAYKTGDYSEAQLRVDYINPMLDALGWDVENRAGYAEAYRDVIYEDAVRIGGSSKAPDYGFYIGGPAAGGGRRFFLEAKRPSVAIRIDPAPAYQLRRYAWTAKLPLSILTDFEEFIVFDTRVEPLKTDKATTCAIREFNFRDYPARWHEIASLFSIDAIRRGSFDRFAQSLKKRRGAAPVDEAFLKEIEGWRGELARNLALRNDKLSQQNLNFAVQRTIDRIIFLRMCEDRGIEQTGNLRQLINGDKTYARLGKIFRDADDRYNSGIFHFPLAGRKPDPDRTEAPDDLTLGLEIDDKVLKSIIKRLYDSPYEFSVMPPEILGQVYEQFLGKVITLTAAHHAKIIEKPEVRKAGGVYYTPAYIVNYIVKNTVGRLLGDDAHSPGLGRGTAANSSDARNSSDAPGQGRGYVNPQTPKDAAKLRILDPASGSGSFLIGAYQYLLDWHLRWYLNNNPDEHCKGKNPPLMRITRANGKGRLPLPSGEGRGEGALESGSSPARTRTLTPDPSPRGRGGLDYRLTTARRKEILVNSIFGVDIDPQAVEVTKLSLLLKVLEGESQDTINAQLRLFHQRALPDLGRNIKCGNSLIGPDFYDDPENQKLDDEQRVKINAFDWKREFPDVFKAGGFDAVIGNPPYGFHEIHEASSSHTSRSDTKPQRAVSNITSSSTRLHCASFDAEAFTASLSQLHGLRFQLPQHFASSCWMNTRCARLHGFRSLFSKRRR